MRIHLQELIHFLIQLLLLPYNDSSYGQLDPLYPYDYIPSYDKLYETKLPSQDAFNFNSSDPQEVVKSFVESLGKLALRSYQLNQKNKDIIIMNAEQKRTILN